METLLAAIKSIFYRNTSIKNSNLAQLTATEVSEETKQQSAAVLPKELAEQLESSTIDYELEFVNFLNRHGPEDLAHKFQNMLPYLTASLAAWPGYWLYRGFHWKHKRSTHRLGLYINRTYQQAKLMQVAILGTGLLMSSLTQNRQGTGLPAQQVKMYYESISQS